MTLAFDTLSYAKKLESAGFSEAQARAQAEALAEIVSDNLATKVDIAALQRDIKELETKLSRDIKELELATKADIAALQRDIKELETNLRREIKELETKLSREIVVMSDRLTIRLGGIVVVGVAALAAVVKLL